MYDAVEQIQFFLIIKNDISKYLPVDFSVFAKDIFPKRFYNCAIGSLSFLHQLPCHIVCQDNIGIVLFF